jgi:hypothetical protein
MKFQKDGPKRRRNVRRETHRTPSEFGSYHHDKHATAWSPRSCLRDHRVACYYSLGGRHPFSLTWEIEQYELELDQDRLEMQVYDEHLYSDCDDWYTDDRGYCYIDAPPLDQWGDEIEAYDDDYYDWYREDYRDNWYDEEDDRLRKTFEEDDMWNGTITGSRWWRTEDEIDECYRQHETPEWYEHEDMDESDMTFGQYLSHHHSRWLDKKSPFYGMHDRETYKDLGILPE